MHVALMTRPQLAKQWEELFQMPTIESILLHDLLST